MELGFVQFLRLFQEKRRLRRHPIQLFAQKSFVCIRRLIHLVFLMSHIPYQNLPTLIFIVFTFQHLDSLLSSLFFLSSARLFLFSLTISAAWTTVPLFPSPSFFRRLSFFFLSFSSFSFNYFSFYSFTWLLFCSFSIS